MPTTDPSNVLFKIAHPDLYERNPFNLLNLPINASAKDIRRRKEDIEAAFEAGTEAEEFKYVLPLDNQRKPPTLDAVHEAFDALNDPELRIAYSLFWFWPEEEGVGRGARSSASSDIERLAAQWNEKAKLLPAGTERAKCRHNLAVYKHLSALDGERKMLALPSDNVPTQVVLAICEYWESAISQWNLTLKDVDAWHIVADLVSSLNDPRLDYRFARSLRDQFAFAFDQINVDLAIAFAKAGRASDAKQQVKYMNRSQPDVDDVEGTFDDAFAGLQRQVETIVNAAQDEVDKSPKCGLDKVDEIIRRTQEPFKVSRIIFERGAPIRESIMTTIFSGVRHCMIAYGNETKDWDGCLKRMYALKILAEDDRQRALVAEDEKIIKGNKKAKDAEEICWFCKQQYSPTNQKQTLTLNLWGNMRAGVQFGQVSFSKSSIEVPICHQCLRHVRDYSQYPDVEQLLDAGWQIGYEPSQEDIGSFLRMPRGILSHSQRKNPSAPRGWLRKHMQQSERHEWVLLGIVVTFVVIFVVASITGADDTSSAKVRSQSRNPSQHPPHGGVGHVESGQKYDESSDVWRARRQTPPESGTIRRFHYAVADSPLKISTSPGNNYYVKVVSTYSKTTILDLYVVGGRTEEIAVPSGTYEIRYASGKNWYGYQYLFGPRTTYSKTDRSFTFSEGSGYEITLFKVSNGNLKTKQISPREF